jgi:hypothetical protein
MEVEVVEVRENVHQCLDQPFSSITPKSHKKQMVHKESPISIRHSLCTKEEKRKVKSLLR